MNPSHTATQCKSPRHGRPSQANGNATLPINLPHKKTARQDNHKEKQQATTRRFCSLCFLWFHLWIFKGLFRTLQISCIASSKQKLGLQLFCFALVLSPYAPCLAIDFIEIVEEKKQPKNQRQHGFRIEHLPQWVFRNQTTFEKAEKQFLEKLESEAEAIQLTCKLTDNQKDRLMLAGQGDIQAFLQSYAEIHASFKEKLKRNNQQEVQKIWQEIQPLQKKFQSSLFGEGSLFEKVLGPLLDEQQSARLEQLRREQRKFQYRSAVMQLILQIDQASPLTHENRKKLLALIDQHTFPPKSIPSQNRGHYFRYYVLWQMAEIPEDELQPLFGKPAWKMLEKQIKQGTAMKSNLERQGWVPGKE